MFFDTVERKELPDNQSMNLPNGWYNAEILDVWLNTTKDLTGSYIKLQFGITDEAYKDVRVYGYLNLTNNNPKAVKFSQWQLGKIMDALGMATLKDPVQLKEGGLAIRVITETSDVYGDQLKIKDYGPLIETMAQSQSA